MTGALSSPQPLPAWADRLIISTSATWQRIRRDEFANNAPSERAVYSVRVTPGQTLYDYGPAIGITIGTAEETAVPLIVMPQPGWEPYAGVIFSSGAVDNAVDTDCGATEVTTNSGTLTVNGSNWSSSLITHTIPADWPRGNLLGPPPVAPSPITYNGVTATAGANGAAGHPYGGNRVPPDYTGLPSWAAARGPNLGYPLYDGSNSSGGADIIDAGSGYVGGTVGEYKVAFTVSAYGYVNAVQILGGGCGAGTFYCAGSLIESATWLYSPAGSGGENTYPGDYTVPDGYAEVVSWSSLYCTTIIWAPTGPIKNIGHDVTTKLFHTEHRVRFI